MTHEEANAICEYEQQYPIHIAAMLSGVFFASFEQRIVEEEARANGLYYLSRERGIYQYHTQVTWVPARRFPQLIPTSEKGVKHT